MRKKCCLATLSRKSIFRNIESIHTNIFCVYASRLDARHEKALNLIFYRLERKSMKNQQIYMIAIPNGTQHQDETVNGSME